MAGLATMQPQLVITTFLKDIKIVALVATLLLEEALGFSTKIFDDPGGGATNICFFVVVAGSSLKDFDFS